MLYALKTNWKVYAMEAISLGLFMVSASLFATLLEYPMSPVRLALPAAFIRTVIMGIAMGLTASLIIYSPMGKLSGAHMNPAISFTFLALGKMKKQDAIYYTLFQCLGGILAVYMMSTLLGSAFSDPHVNYVVTMPGNYGAPTAFVAEVAIAFLMMIMVLITSNHVSMARYTGVIAGVFVAMYVIITGPVSGFGMNPARSLASAVPAMQFPSFWIYILAPFTGMLTAAGVFKFFNRVAICAKLHHSPTYHCIFNCGYCKHDQD